MPVGAHDNQPFSLHPFCRAPGGKCVPVGECYSNKQCQYEPDDAGALYGDGMTNEPALRWPVGKRPELAAPYGPQTVTIALVVKGTTGPAMSAEVGIDIIRRLTPGDTLNLEMSLNGA